MNIPVSKMVVVAGSLLLLTGCGSDVSTPQKSDPEAPAEMAGEQRAFELKIVPDDNDPTRVTVHAIARTPAVWNRLDVEDDRSIRGVLSFSLDSPSSEKKPNSRSSMFGTYAVHGGSLVFEPAVSLHAGERYLAVFHPTEIPGTAKSAKPLRAEYQVPNTRPSAQPRIIAVYPSGDRLPANHLKFYLVFSEPMQPGDVFKHFRLDNLTTGKRVPRPFRHTELWSPDQKRFTLWFHPGRQKPGVNLNVEIGPVLIAGNRYRLSISGKWTSETGKPLETEFTKEFRAVTMDNAQPDPKTWKVSAPESRTRKPLRVTFPEPLDWALCLSEIRVADEDGKPVPGRIAVGNKERQWSFTPDSPWNPGRYRIAVNTLLEDLGGNSVERKFNVDLLKTPAKRVGRTVTIPFRVSAE